MALETTAKKEDNEKNSRIMNEANTATLLRQLHPDLYRIYSAMRSLFELGENGSIEIHFVRKRIRQKNGLYMKPGFSDDEIRQKLNNLK